MTALPPDPDPAETPGLEPGGGVEPGDTPPDSGETSGLSAAQPPARRKYTPATVAGIAAVVLFALLFVVVAVLLLAHILV
jgi:hypothetical protein